MCYFTYAFCTSAYGTWLKQYSENMKVLSWDKHLMLVLLFPVHWIQISCFTKKSWTNQLTEFRDLQGFHSDCFMSVSHWSIHSWSIASHSAESGLCSQSWQRGWEVAHPSRVCSPSRLLQKWQKARQRKFSCVGTLSVDMCWSSLEKTDVLKCFYTETTLENFCIPADRHDSCGTKREEKWGV